MIGGLAFFVHAQRSIRRDMIDAESLLELFQKEPTVKDGPNQFTFKCGTIHFHNVGFSYDGKKETIQDFNFHAVSGQKIALVGETGGGKSTILKLLFRFYDVQQGKILIDDQDIKEVSLQSLRQCIGVVPQDPALFNESVMENVRYSKLGASDEDVREACKAAAIHEKILTFSEGYQTKVGENGVKLSGGELQRIAIARVILKNPEIVLLDEATSAVDTETEACIQEALYKMTKGRTTITIAHRLSTVTSSDTIVVIKGGKIVESGPPHALLKAKGKFSELWFKQVGINPRPTNEEPVDEKAADQGDAPKAGHNERRTRLPEGSSSSNKSLRPTAPEFVPSKTFIPRHQRGPVAKGQSSPHPAHTSGHQESNDESTTKSNSGKPQQKRKLPANHLIDNVGSDTQWDTSDSKPEGAKQTETKKKRLNPAQRRRNNKSDPSASAFRPNQHDGPLDGPMLDESAESSAMELGSRRVSAPARPLSTITNTQEGGRAQRRRTQRWHNRNRQSLEPAHATTSAERSSSAWSNDTLHPPTPVVRLPSSADDTASKSEINVTGAGNGSVRFEPGL